jgi:hypothetical protein
MYVFFSATSSNMPTTADSMYLRGGTTCYLLLAFCVDPDVARDRISKHQKKKELGAWQSLVHTRGVVFELRPPESATFHSQKYRGARWMSCLFIRCHADYPAEDVGNIFEHGRPTL